jgi:hypothetical protein
MLSGFFMVTFWPVMVSVISVMVSFLAFRVTVMEMIGMMPFVQQSISFFFQFSLNFRLDSMLPSRFLLETGEVFCDMLARLTELLVEIVMLRMLLVFATKQRMAAVATRKKTSQAHNGKRSSDNFQIHCTYRLVVQYDSCPSGYKYDVCAW